MLGSDTSSSPPGICTGTSSSQNSSRYRNVSLDLDREDHEILNILKEMLEGSKESESVIPEFKKTSEMKKDSTSVLTTVENRLCGYLCPETIFNLRHRVLTNTQIKVLEKGLDFAQIQLKFNETESRRDFNESCIRMRLKWHFQDEPQGFNETPAFTPKSTWHPSKGHACLEVFLSQVEKEIFDIPSSGLKYSNMSREDRQAVRSLADDRSILIKKADKGSCVLVWDRNDYLQKAERQLSNTKVYRNVSNTENILRKLSETNSRMFNSLKRRYFLTEKQMKYFTNDF